MHPEFPVIINGGSYVNGPTRPIAINARQTGCTTLDLFDSSDNPSLSRYNVTPVILVLERCSDRPSSSRYQKVIRPHTGTQHVLAPLTWSNASTDDRPITPIPTLAHTDPHGKRVSCTIILETLTFNKTSIFFVLSLLFSPLPLLPTLRPATAHR